jgi:hypothetical protein
MPPGRRRYLRDPQSNLVDPVCDRPGLSARSFSLITRYKDFADKGLD